MTIDSSNPNINVDPKDIKYMSALAKDWWDPRGSQQPLHDMNKLRIEFVSDGLIATNVMRSEMKGKENALEGLTILDVGCGGGILTEELGRYKAKTVGLDAAEALINLANQHMQPQKHLYNYITYVCETIEDHCIKNSNKYDAIVCSEVIEHIVDKKSFLEACVKTLKPGGSIFITTLSKTAVSWFLGILWAEWILGIIKRGTHSWSQFITAKNVEKILNEFDCKTVLVRGTRYEFYRHLWKFQKYTGFNYMLQAVKNS